METRNSDYLQLEIRADAIMALVNQGALVVEDVRALNSQSREGVRAILLSALKAL